MDGDYDHGETSRRRWELGKPSEDGWQELKPRQGAELTQAWTHNLWEQPVPLGGCTWLKQQECGSEGGARTRGRKQLAQSAC